MLSKNRIKQITELSLENLEAQLKDVKNKTVLLEGAIQGINIYVAQLYAEFETENNKYKPQEKTEKQKNSPVSKN